MSDPAQYLEWDTEFFGKRIARANVSQLDDAAANELLAWCAAHAIDCLYLLADAEDKQTVRRAEINGFQLVDIRLTLKRHTPLQAEKSTENIRPFQPSDIPALKAIARVSHHDSRFYYDPRFPDEQCDRLYETWIENSCKGYADQVLVAVDAEAPVGYITCHLLPSHGEIGLLGVSTGTQRKGYGTQLIQASLTWFAEHDRRSVSVVTQGRNVGAQRVYQKNGFLTNSVQLWYHRWF
jgi:dTDP-4-amino-4,6-dideoxy-D-galactose acyltransferase